MNRVKISLIVGCALLLVGCVASKPIQVRQLGDQSLTCLQLKGEFEELDAALEEIDSRRGATGTNIAAAIFWLPGLIYTYLTARDADKSIEQRRENLILLYETKNCS